MHIDNAVDDDTIIASMYMNNGLFNSIPLSPTWLAAGCPPFCTCLPAGACFLNVRAEF